ncbi:cell wall integrity and stress response component [Microdochium nivale]|nr:cell wall integrity and stress response component [Microdochium nivale]
MATSTLPAIQPYGYIQNPPIANDSLALVVTQNLLPPKTVEGGVVSLQVATFYAFQSTGIWGDVPPAKTTTPSVSPTTPVSPSTTRQSTVTSISASHSAELPSTNTSVPNSGAPESTELTLPAPSGASQGVVVGAAIGSLLAGILVGALIAWFILRRGKKQQQGPAYAAVSLARQPEKQSPTVVTAERSPHPGDILDKFLLDSKPDTEIVSEIRNLNVLIQQHVEENFDLRPLDINIHALAKPLGDLEIGSGTHEFNPTELANHARETSSRHATLRFVIAQAAFNACSVHNPGPITLLPQNLGAIVRNIPPVEAHRGSVNAVDAALSRWRQLSAFLLNPSRSERTSLRLNEAEVANQSHQLATALKQFLLFFIREDRRQAYEKDHNLQMIILECARLGYVLFSQPAEFRWMYQKHSGSKAYKLIAFPGLEKLRDEGGWHYNEPVTVMAPILMNA